MTTALVYGCAVLFALCFGRGDTVGEEGCDFDQPVFVSPHCRERYCAWKYDAVVGENVTLVCTVNYTADSGSSLYLSYASCRQPCSPLRQDCPSNKTLPCRISHVIRAVKEIDEDRWTCSVHHPQCLNHNSIELKLNVRPQKAIKLDKSPVNHTVKVGETVSFDSYAEGYPEPTPEWWHDGLFMASSPHINVDDNGTVTIFNVTKDDAGVYSVTWQGKCGKVASSANLEVEEEHSAAGHKYPWWLWIIGGIVAIALVLVIGGFIRKVGRRWFQPTPPSGAESIDPLLGARPDSERVSYSQLGHSGGSNVSDGTLDEEALKRDLNGGPSSASSAGSQTCPKAGDNGSENNGECADRPHSPKGEENYDLREDI